MPSERIKGLKEFHESYYEHSCAIHDRKKDVLKSDIPGNSFKTKLKRWWYGLFLVSYSDERARTYYTSSEAMRLDRTHQFRHFKGRIHPLSKFRNFWDLMMLFLFVLNFFAFHHNSSIIYSSNFCLIIGPVIELFVIADVIVNIHTGYTDDDSRRVVLDKYEGVMHYLSTKFFFHVASAIPLQWLMILRYGISHCHLCKANLFTLILRVMGVFGLLRIIECSNYLTRARDSFLITSFFRFSRVFLIGILTVLYVNDICDRFMLMIMIREGKIMKNSYVGAVIYFRFVDPNPLPSHILYLLNFVRAIQSVSQFDFTDENNYYLDKLVLIITNLTVFLFHLWSILEIFAFLIRTYFCDSSYYKIKQAAVNFAHCSQLPDKITKKLSRYYDSNHSYTKSVEVHNFLYKTIPHSLRADVVLATYKGLIMRIPYFSQWPPHLLREISLLLKEDAYLNNDLVAEPWVQSDGLTIVAVGEMAVYEGTEERGHLIDGDFFGELSLVTDKELRTSSVVAITFCVVVLLDKILFRKVMREYPELFATLKQQLKEKFNQN